METEHIPSQVIILVQPHFLSYFPGQLARPVLHSTPVRQATTDTPLSGADLSRNTQDYIVNT